MFEFNHLPDFLYASRQTNSQLTTVYMTSHRIQLPWIFTIYYSSILYFDVKCFIESVQTKDRQTYYRSRRLGRPDGRTPR